MARTVYLHAAAGIGPNASPMLAFQASPAEKLSADAVPLGLRELGKSMGIALPRLVSRFAELAVIGARLCADQLDLPLPRNTPLYLATGLGDVVRTDGLYFQVMPPNSEMASPAKFATSGNNLGAFFVAQQLGLVSRNLTISQLDLSLEHALTLALDDLEAASATSALVGSVDESTAPRRFYRRRFPLSADKYIGEGSAWLVLGTQARGAIGEVLGVAIDSTFDNEDERAWADGVSATLQSFVDPKSSATLLPGVRLSDSQINALLARQAALMLHDYRDFSGCLPTAAGLAIVSTFTAKLQAPATYVHVNCDAEGHTGMIVWRVYA